MRKLTLLAVFVIGMITTAQAQLKVVSRTVNISKYNSKTKEYVVQKTREVKNYITWEKGELSIICQDCGTTKFLYTITGKDNSSIEKDGKGFEMHTYTAVRIPEGTEVNLLVGYQDNEVMTVGVSYDAYLIVYRDLKDY